MRGSYERAIKQTLQKANMVREEGNCTGVHGRGNCDGDNKKIRNFNIFTISVDLSL